jgi:hypothetical protein
VSDDALPPPPPDTFAVGEFTVHLRPGLNRTWRAHIADRDGPCMMVRGLGRERAIRRARAWCLRAMKRPAERPRKRRPRLKGPVLTHRKRDGGFLDRPGAE